VLPDRDTRSFLFEVWDWLLSNRGGVGAFRTRARLVTPTREDFPVDSSLAHHELALDYFGFVKEHIGVTDWTGLLVPDEIGGTRGDAATAIDSPESSDVPSVHYRGAAVTQPVRLIAQLSVGLVRLVVEATEEAPPGGAEASEYVIDVATTYFGFGLFLANSAMPPRPELDPTLTPLELGEAALDERELAYALAIFSWLLEVSDASVMRHLRPNPRGYYRAAVMDLRRRAPELARLKRSNRPVRGPYR
jgi:hypothetical protein